MLTLALASILSLAEPPVVSVLYFDNQSSDAELEFMRKGFADLLITDLTAWQGVKVVERTRLEDVLKELKLQQTKYVDPASAAKLGKILNANYLVYGSMLVSGPKLLVQARLVRANDGQVVIALKETDDRDQVFELEQRLANQLIAQIDDKLSPNPMTRRKAKVPDLATVAAFGRALDLSDQGKLDEAQAALRAMVSKAPTFLLGRERLEAQVKAFEAYQKRRRDEVDEAVLALGKRIDEVLADEAKFDTLTTDQRALFLTMRTFKGRLLVRLMKPLLSRRVEYFRVAKPGEEAKLVVAMRAWVDNQRRLIDELRRARVIEPYGPNGTIPPVERERLTNAKLGDVGIDSQPMVTLARFVLRGYLIEATVFQVGPTLGAVDPKERKRVLAEVDESIAQTLVRADAGPSFSTYDAVALLEVLADDALWRGDVEGAVTAYQRELDGFPTAKSNEKTEERIQEILSGRSHTLEPFENWQKMLKDCDDMLIRRSTELSMRRMSQQGLSALDTLPAETLKACPVNRRNEDAYAGLFGKLAGEAAQHDDCVRARALWVQYLAHGGSVADFRGWIKHSEWCPMEDILKDVSFMHGTLDRDWSFEFREGATSVMSTDGKVLTVRASQAIREFSGTEILMLRLERGSDGKFSCTSASWDRGDEHLRGSCSVSLSKQVDRGGVGFDEGIFEATIQEGTRVRTLTKGQVRARREN